MRAQPDELHILLIDDDDRLLSDAVGLEHERVVFRTARTTAEARIRCATAAFDVVVVSLDLAGGEDFIRESVRRKNVFSVIAIAGAGAKSMTLEYRLLRAELRGAKAALPKPIDAIELAIAAVGVYERDCSCDCNSAGLIAELERKLAY